MRTLDTIRIARLILIVVLLLTGMFPLAYGQDVASPESDPSRPSIAFYTADDENKQGSINVELRAGEQTTVAVVLGNTGADEFEAVTYAADAYTLRNGGFGLREMDGDPSGPTTWLDYPTETFLTVPGQSVERVFTISVPETAGSGEYVTGIAMQTVNPVNVSADEGVFRFNEFYRTVIGIRILVPGELQPSLQFGEPAFILEGAVPAIVVPVMNVGNRQTTPEGEITLMDGEGNLVLSAPVSMGRIYGGHETELWLGLNQPLPEGEYQISVTLQDEEKGVSAELPPTTFAVTDLPDLGLAEQAPITITSVTAAPMPDADNVQFLTVDATVTNTDEPVANAQLSLIASVDGVEVERFPISQSLSLPTGNTDVSTRYIPVTGWTSGEWEFELLLETVEGSGAAVVVASVPIDVEVTVP